MAFTLIALAERLGATLRGGEGGALVHRVATLAQADAGAIAFYVDQKYRADLHETRAGAVILAEPHAAWCPVPVLLTPNPTLAYARAARLLHPLPEVVGGRHPSAVVDAAADVHPSAWIGATAVVEPGAVIGERVFVGPGCILGAGCRVGDDSRLVARVTLCEGTRIGRRALIHPGAVIGREGFGFAKDGPRWERIPQLGGVAIGDDVEIGANTTIDRGTLGDTVIADGVKLDNLIQVGHNCRIGESTAMAACSGISGSTTIGAHCTLGGAVGMAGHLTIGDNVHFTGMAMVTRSFPAPGAYSSGIPAMPSAEWRRNAVRFKHLDALVRRVARLEEALAIAGVEPPPEDP